jgi:allantoicase
MKIGLSLSRCIRDIFTGAVEENDVLVIIARTDFDPHNDNHWNNIWEGYTQGGLSRAEWADFRDEYVSFRRLALELYDDGKIHQPRHYGAHPPRLPYHWLDCVVRPQEHNPAQAKAWQNYLTITDLSK